MLRAWNDNIFQFLLHLGYHASLNIVCHHGHQDGHVLDGCFLYQGNLILWIMNNIQYVVVFQESCTIWS
jgi:hypothetical protein